MGWVLQSSTSGQSKRRTMYLGNVLAFSLNANEVDVYTVVITGDSEGEALAYLKNAGMKEYPTSGYHRHEFFVKPVADEDVDILMNDVRPVVVSDGLDRSNSYRRRGRSLVS